MKSQILALDFIGLIFTIIGFFILSNQPPRFRVVVKDENNKERTKSIENAYDKAVTKWKEGVMISIFGFALQTLSIWLSIIES
jgi:hypothetical protein